MNVTVKKGVVTILLLVLSLSILKAPVLPEALKKEIDKKAFELYQLQLEWDNAYEEVVKSLKKREGFMEYSYYCPGGVLTIGYGHAIKSNEFFCEPMDEEMADFLLRQDLDSAIAFVQKTTELEHLQLLAMGHFVYNVGIGSFYRSQLRQLILANKPIDEEIIKWIHIKTDKGIIKSDWLLRSRKMELELFKLTT